MPSPHDWNTLDQMIGPSECDEAVALAEVHDRLMAGPSLMQLRACALAVAVVARRLEARGVAAELQKEANPSGL